MNDKTFDVCIVTTIHTDFDNRIYQRQLAALVDSGLSVCIVAPWNFDERKRSDYKFIRTVMPVNRPARVLHGFRTYRAARSVAARMYIFHDPDFLIFGLALKWRTGNKVVYDCHENIPEDILYGKDWIPRPLRYPVSLAFRLIENQVVKALGAAIVVVPHLERRFLDLGADTILVRNFANFTVSETFRNEPAALYTGSMSRDYGAYVLLDIAREIKRRGCRIPLRVVDRFSLHHDLRDEFMKIVSTEQLDVEILRPVNAADMPKILARGNIGLSPILNSKNKALAYPTKIFEYFAFGLAVIASNVGSTTEILENGRLGILVDADDCNAWVDALEKLYFDDRERSVYVRAGRNAAAEKFNWNQEKRKLLSFVSRSIASRDE